MVLFNQINIYEGLLRIEMDGFIRGFSSAIYPLIDFILSDARRNHPVWGQLIPDTIVYGLGSKAYCIRPDIILTSKGAKIGEIDFVPSGRGFLLDCLNTFQHKKQYLGSYKKWYGRIGVRDAPIAYAAATMDSCLPEMERFCNGMREFFNIDIQAVNVDNIDLSRFGLVDRLFYEAEMATPKNIGDTYYVSAESSLDSKLIMAMIHDASIEIILRDAIGLNNLLFLRSVIPKTYVLKSLRETQPVFLEQVVRDRSNYLIKNGEVENISTWGARGLLDLKEYSEKEAWRALFENISPNPKKDIGNSPILQEVAECLNFSDFWDAAVKGTVNGLSLGPGSISEIGLAQSHIYSRLGVYFLLSNENRLVTIPQFGILTLRPERIAHGANNAMAIAARVRL